MTTRRPDIYEINEQSDESDDDVVVSSVDGASTRQADSATADTLVTTTPERSGLSEPARSRRAGMSLDTVVVTPQYPLRGQVKARDARQGAAGRG